MSQMSALAEERYQSRSNGGIPEPLNVQEIIDSMKEDYVTSEQFINHSSDGSGRGASDAAPSSVSFF
jgi:hypothetical protein